MKNNGNIIFPFSYYKYWADTSKTASKKVAPEVSQGHKLSINYMTCYLSESFNNVRNSRYLS